MPLKAINDFLRTTIFGGLVFLVPVILLLLVLRHAMQFAGKIAKPVAAMFPTQAVGGIALGTLVAIFLLLVIAFLAGLLARTPTGRRLTQWFEESILGGLPQYQMAKTMAESFARIEGESSSMQPVLVLIDEGWNLAYRLEDVGEGWVTVFVPQSPTPMSGSVMYVESTRVRPLPISMKEAVLLVKHLGIGSSQALRGVKLGAPPDASLP